MAAIGIDGVHKVIGYFCDLCGEECEGDKEELNALGTSRSCVPLPPSPWCINQLEAVATQATSPLSHRMHLPGLRG